MRANVWRGLVSKIVIIYANMDNVLPIPISDLDTAEAAAGNYEDPEDGDYADIEEEAEDDRAFHGESDDENYMSEDSHESTDIFEDWYDEEGTGFCRKRAGQKVNRAQLAEAVKNDPRYKAGHKRAERRIKGVLEQAASYGRKYEGLADEDIDDIIQEEDRGRYAMVPDTEKGGYDPLKLLAWRLTGRQRSGRRCRALAHGLRMEGTMKAQKVGFDSSYRNKEIGLKRSRGCARN
ncbi:hypothetical protein KVT40_000457 [Elsinoe batatas]|uniref:Uncharacterized protein n=1 Tax=Elsinoe batatas TaxID=2601811 RepID=A0A8K0L9C3_9PEZI|nr:hypothetical protein KVT40_000457 [Elsinoe batatas]